MENNHDEFGIYAAPPKASRSLILACLGSAFAVAVIVGLIVKHGLF